MRILPFLSFNPLPSVPSSFHILHAVLSHPFLPLCPIPSPVTHKLHCSHFQMLAKRQARMGPNPPCCFCYISKLHKILLDLCLYLPSSQYPLSLLEIGCEGQKYVLQFQRFMKVTLPNLPSICMEEQNVAHYLLCLPVSILNAGLTPVTLLFKHT